jgi:hypothetical protein
MMLRVTIVEHQTYTVDIPCGDNALSNFDWPSAEDRALVMEWVRWKRGDWRPNPQLTGTSLAGIQILGG